MKQRFYLLSGGLVLVVILFFFASTPPPKAASAPEEVPAEAMIDPVHIIDSLKTGLTASQSDIVRDIESKVGSSGSNQERVGHLDDLANFWKDSLNAAVPYMYYLDTSAKLDNSEKSLTFAAQFIFENMRREPRMDFKLWEAATAADLFRQALKLSPDNADLKIGLGSCYVYGPGMTGNPQQAMRGIQELLEVVKADSNNMKAQLVLGIASVISNQFDKGIERLEKVANFDPGNLEAISWLGDAYAAKGDIKDAKKWYEQSKNIVNDPAFSKEVDQRIKMLEQEQ